MFKLANGHTDRHSCCSVRRQGTEAYEMFAKFSVGKKEQSTERFVCANRDTADVAAEIGTSYGFREERVSTQEISPGSKKAK